MKILIAFSKGFGVKETLFGHAEFPANDLVPGFHIPDDIDAFKINLGPFPDLPAEIDFEGSGIFLDLRTDFDKAYPS
jgi:hypothetical protein